MCMCVYISICVYVYVSFLAFSKRDGIRYSQIIGEWGVYVCGRKWGGLSVVSKIHDFIDTHCH